MKWHQIDCQSSTSLPKNNDSIIDKERKIPASLWADCSAREEYDDVASSDAPFSLTIKGRGNASWLQPKKPYKIKFDKKQSIFGLPKNKHYALLADIQMMGPLSIAGMELGRQIGMSWAPMMVPVELVLNGNYEGSYLLAESVKIGAGRIDIYEQPENNEDESSIPYGWLVEIDNYNDEFQITLPEKDGALLRITHKSPESLSTAQRTWLIDEFTTINEAIYQEDKNATPWIDYIDITSFAKYFIVSEVMNNLDAYTGSFYLHKDAGENTLWVAGPLWDLSWCQPKSNWVIYSREDHLVHWMKELIKYPAFTNEINRLWSEFYPLGVNAALEYLDGHKPHCIESTESNNNRWPDLKLSHDRFDFVKNLIINNAEWVNENLPAISNSTVSVSQLYISDLNVNVNGKILTVNYPERIKEIKLIDLTGKAIELRGSCGQIDLSTFSKGIYIILVSDVNGNSSITKVII